MTQLPPFLTPRQAAEALTAAGVSITDDGVRRWCRRGQIPAVTTPGGSYRIRGEVIQAILDGRPLAAASS